MKSDKFYNQEIECLPLYKLAELQDKKLKASQVIERAFESALYGKNWLKAGIEPSHIKSRVDLKTVPFITGNDIRVTFENFSVDDIITTEDVRLWFCTSGTTGSAKWLPYGDDELSLFEEVLMRNFYVQTSKEQGNKLLILTTAAPFVADGLTHVSIFAELLHGLQNEHITVAATGVADVISLAHNRKVDVLFSFPSVAMRIAESITTGIKDEIDRRYKYKRNLSSLIALVGLRFKKISIKDIIKCRYGLFSGEALAPYRQAIIDTYGIEPFEIYTFTEFPCLNMECSMHNGIHLWSDTCIPELIPQEELDKEERTRGYKPRSVFLDQTEAGMTGEYVVTTFSQALPLIRYRTSDLIEVVGLEPCGCGRTHPRIRVLRRVDDIINMGLIRFSLLELEAKLADLCQSKQISRWQLRMEREGYKPKPVLLVELGKTLDEQILCDMVLARLLEIEVLRTGCLAGIVNRPEIRVVAQIKEQITSTGKVRKVVYANNW